jgi:hypothetical protein
MLAQAAGGSKRPISAFYWPIHARLLAALLSTCCLCCLTTTSAGAAETSRAVEPSSILKCERWGYAELVFKGPATGNPFSEVELEAKFTQEDREQHVSGFYDGDGVYRVRFMPDAVGTWKFVTSSNDRALDDRQGEIEVTEPSEGNHGPVRVANTFHFAYADGMPYRQLGTTCYAWTHQTEELQNQTLKTLKESPFNKLRMCVFPKRYTWNENEPPLYPFEGTPPTAARYVPSRPGQIPGLDSAGAKSRGQWDYTRFNPRFFQHLERRVLDLQKLGVEADVILLHPYDEGHWGFDRMPDDVDDRYLRYVVARLSAFRNVWWSMANEFDFMTEKQPDDWDRMIQVVADADPHDRLLSIHNGRLLYNHTHALLTHASIQNGSAAEEAGRAVLYRDVYRKPIVFDEIKYEGDIPKRWGNLSAEEMVHRFWECIIAGTYPGHGECYLQEDDVLWWSKGGVLRGQSPPRIEFLRKVLETAPAEGVEPIDKWQYANIAGKAGQYYLVYFGKEQPTRWKFFLPRHELADGVQFKIELLDTWNMSVSPVDWTATVRAESEYIYVDNEGREVSLPGKPWMALRITRLESEQGQ